MSDIKNAKPRGRPALRDKHNYGGSTHRTGCYLNRGDAASINTACNDFLASRGMEPSIFNPWKDAKQH
jgi:hypothetical protein